MAPAVAIKLSSLRKGDTVILFRYRYYLHYWAEKGNSDFPFPLNFPFVIAQCLWYECEFPTANTLSLCQNLFYVGKLTNCICSPEHEKHKKFHKKTFLVWQMAET